MCWLSLLRAVLHKSRGCAVKFESGAGIIDGGQVPRRDDSFEIGPTWDKSQFLKDQSQYILSDLEKSLICLIWNQFDPL